MYHNRQPGRQADRPPVDVDQRTCAPNVECGVITDGNVRFMVEEWLRKHCRRFRSKRCVLVRQIGFRYSHSSLRRPVAMIGLDDVGRAPVLAATTMRVPHRDLSGGSTMRLLRGTLLSHPLPLTFHYGSIQSAPVNRRSPSWPLFP